MPTQSVPTDLGFFRLTAMIGSWCGYPSDLRGAREVEISTAFGLTGAILIPGEKDEPSFSRRLAYFPAPTLTYSLWYRRRYMVISRVEARTGPRRSKEETLQIRILSRNRNVLDELLREARKCYFAHSSQHGISICVSNANNQWHGVASRAKRDINSVILDPGVSQFLLNDARDFLRSKAWYAARGIPYRRGYLLYGAPGSGKTSIISSLAGELGLDIYILPFSRRSFTDSALWERIEDLPEKCILLMEDIDAIFTPSLNRGVDPPVTDDGRPPRPGKPPRPLGKLSLGDILNALDGVASQEGRILFATTNNYSALDPALCRPGRMDVQIEFKLASKFQARKLFATFYIPEDDVTADASEQEEDLSCNPPARTDVDAESASSEKPAFVGASHRCKAPKLRRAQVAVLAARFADVIPEREVSMAALQGFLLMHKVRPYEAVRSASAWVESEREARVKLEGQAQGLTPEGVTPAR